MADGAWKSTGGALVAFAVGAVAAFGGRGLADAGVQPIWIWVWAIAAFAAFVGGLCFWAVSASNRWAGARGAPAAVPRPVDDGQATPPVEVPPGQVIAWEDDSDRAYRELVELHRPDTGRAG